MSADATYQHTATSVPIRLAAHPGVGTDTDARGARSRGATVVARVALNPVLSIMALGRRGRSFRSSAQASSVVPTDAGRALGRARPALFSESLVQVMFGRLLGRRGVFRLLAAAGGILAATIGTAAWRWAHE